MATLAKSSLSAPRQRLVEIMQRLNFGRIERLEVRNGEPSLDQAPPRIVLEVKLAGENGPRPGNGAPDFILKTQLVDLFAHFDRLKNARIDVLSIKHGLPFTMDVEDVT